MNAGGTSRGMLARSRIALSFIFFLWGCGYAMWGVHIPTVQARLDVEPAILGLALLALGVGAVLGQPMTGFVIARVGSRASTVSGALLFAVIFPTPILAPNVPCLFLATFAFGLSAGIAFVALNTQASEIEVARGRPTMSSFHEFFQPRRSRWFRQRRRHRGGRLGRRLGCGRDRRRNDRRHSHRSLLLVAEWSAYGKSRPGIRAAKPSCACARCHCLSLQYD